MKLVVLLSLLRVREFAPMLSNEHGNKLFNSGKAEMPILSQAEDESSEGAETTGEVQSS